MGTATQIKRPSAFEPRDPNIGRPRAVIYGLKKGDMAAIDYATCGINDVIAHSLKLHPTCSRTAFGLMRACMLNSLMHTTTVT